MGRNHENQIQLYVEKRGACNSGEPIPLNRSTYLAGRMYREHQQDIPWSSQSICRRYAVIEYDGRYYRIMNLNATGRTMLNHTIIKKGVPYRLANGDTIDLGPAMQINVTAGMDAGRTFFTNRTASSGRFVFDAVKREVVINGSSLELAGNKFELLALLYENIGRAVHEEEIKCRVWPQSIMADNTSDIDSGLVKRLVFELRKALGPHRRLVKTKKKYGYMLDEKYLEELNEAAEDA